MYQNGYVIDHMDNNGHNCSIDNLCFLLADENKAKGFTVDKMSEEKTHIALSLYKNFSTELIQITIMFNYPAIAKISKINSPAVIDLVYLLYDREYPEVINDARTILYDYYREHIFEPKKLHYIDYHIEGAYGAPIPIEVYDEYVAGGHGHAICFFNKIAPIRNWQKNDSICF